MRLMSCCVVTTCLVSGFIGMSAFAGDPGASCFAPIPAGIPSTTGGLTALSPSFVPDCSGANDVYPGAWYQVFGTGTTITASTCGGPLFDTRISVYCGDCENLSDCCYDNGDPGCVNPDCEAAVCVLDGFCCDTAWDDICANLAEDECGSLCGSTLQCIAFNDNDCVDGVSSTVSWCSQPTARYLVYVHGPAATPFDLTLSENGLPCTASNQCLPPPCTGDTNSDKDVDVNDLNNVIVAWGTNGALGLDPATGQPALADITDNFGGPPDGVVNVNDLNAVIVNWGPCFFAPGNDECPDKIDVDLLPNDQAFVSLDMVAATASTFGVSGGCGNCNEPNGTPGCSGPNCQALVCALDAFCCDTEWDQLCADAAIANCGCSTPQCTPPAKDVWFCLTYDNDPAAVAADLTVRTTIDVFLEIYTGCDCADPAGLKWCGPGLGGSDPIPVMNGDQCCVRVLNANNLPNALLVGELVTAVVQPCGPGTGDCCSNNGTPGCDDPDCCNMVCGVDPFCCDTSWDQTCANQASMICTEICPGCGDAIFGDCCEDNGTPFCEDPICCETVCSFNPSCCEVAWDMICADEARAMCDGLCPAACGDPTTGDCCFTHPEPYCNDPVCCESVCAIQPFCCDVEWDFCCVQTAEQECDFLCEPPAGPPLGGCAREVTPEPADSVGAVNGPQVGPGR